jgi:lambda family phage portal protein
MAFWDLLKPSLINKNEAMTSRKLAKRHYAAANQGRLFEDFKASNRSADTELRPALTVLRNRARDLTRNDPYAKRFLNLMRVNVVGESGLNMQVKARNVDGSLDVIGNEQIERAFADWARDCTVDGMMSWNDVQQYAEEAMKRDGEAFIEIVRGPSFKYGFALNPIEADLIDEQKNQRLPNGNEIRMGVELNRYRRPIAYWVRQAHPGDFDYTTLNQAVSVRVPAERILHFYKPTRAGQTRGETAFAPIMTSLKMMSAHREAELVASRLAASKMGFFVSDTGDDFNADDYDDKVPIYDAEPGTFHQLPKGVDFKEYSPSHPTTAFSDFQKGILRGIASGLGVSYSSLSGDLEGTSYSSIRQGALEERDFYKLEQRFLIEHLAHPIYAAWLRHVMEFGFISIPVTKFDKFYTATIFRARGFSWIDPQREMTASVMGMHNGLLTPSEIAAADGRDIDEVYSTWQRDKQLAEFYDLKLAFEPFGANEATKDAMPLDGGSDASQAE